MKKQKPELYMGIKGLPRNITLLMYELLQEEFKRLVAQYEKSKEKK